jgi:hypothetical protein
MRIISMSTRTFPIALIAFSFLVSGCSDQGVPVTTTVTLKDTETYQYPTVGGDEESARIVTQAQHYRISEIRRDAQTNWVAVYVYQPALGYTGSDYVELEIETGSDGASPPSHSKRIGLVFQITQ